MDVPFAEDFSIPADKEAVSEKDDSTESSQNSAVTRTQRWAKEDSVCLCQSQKGVWLSFETYKTIDVHWTIDTYSMFIALRQIQCKTF